MVFFWISCGILGVIGFGLAFRDFCTVDPHEHYLNYITGVYRARLKKKKTPKFERLAPDHDPNRTAVDILRESIKIPELPDRQEDHSWSAPYRVARRKKYATIGLDPDKDTDGDKGGRKFDGDTDLVSLKVKMKVLRQMISSLREGKENPTFSEFIGYAQTVLSLDDDACAGLFDVPVPAVRKWREGQTVPAPSIRKMVYRVLTDYMDDA